MSERMNSSFLLQLVKGDTHGEAGAGDRRVMVGFQGGWADQDEWANFRPSGVNVDAWNAMIKTHRVWSGTIEWDYNDFAFIAPMVFGTAVDTDEADGVTTVTYALPDFGERTAIQPFTVEYGQRDNCEKCHYGLITSISKANGRDGMHVSGQIRILCRKPDAEDIGVPMTGWGGATEVQVLTFTNAPLVQEFALRGVGGTTDTGMFTPATSNADLKTAIEARTLYDDFTATVTGSLTGSATKSGTKTVSFSEQEDAPTLEVLVSESQRLLVTGGDEDTDYQWNGCTAFQLGISEASLQTLLRATGGNWANVVVKGSSALGGVVVSGAGSTEVNGSYTQDGVSNGAPKFSYNDGMTTYWVVYGGSSIWYITDGINGNTSGGGGSTNFYQAAGTAGTVPTSGWTVLGGVSTAPTLAYTASSADFTAYFPFSVGNIAQGTVVGTGAVASTVTQGNAVATTVVPTTTTAGAATHDVTVPLKQPILVPQGSHRRADSIAELDDATAIDKAKGMTMTLGNLVDPVWFADENNLTYNSHVDGADRQQEFSLTLAETSTHTETLKGLSEEQPSGEQAFEHREVHPDAEYSLKIQHYSSIRGAIGYGAAGNVRTREFPLGPVLHDADNAVKFVISYPTPA